MNFVVEKLLKNKFDCYLASYSALDLYFFNKLSKNYLYIVTNASIIDIAKLFEKVDFPKIPYYDISLQVGKVNFLFSCSKSLDNPPLYPFSIQYFFYDLKNSKFISRHNSYNDIKNNKFTLINFNENNALGELSKIYAKYPFTIKKIPNISLSAQIFNINYQKEILINILEGEYPEKGLNLLLRTGFIQKYWEEIYEITKIPHIKDFHPEGNVWEHTLETFKYLKKKNFITILALFLHDIGKAYSEKTKDKPFFKHAEIGSKIAANFLKRLNFDEDIIEAVKFLVKYHMLPPAIEKIPFFKLEPLIKNQNFKFLLEIYRADISSTYKPLTTYYNIKRFYRKYLIQKQG